MITKLDGSCVDVTTLTQRINKKIRSSVIGTHGETFGDIVVKSIRARQSENLPVRPCDLAFELITKHGVREPTIRRQVEVWTFLVTEGIADDKWRFHTRSGEDEEETAETE